MGTLVFQATLGGAVNIIGPNIANTINFTLPSADGTSGQTWTTNGSGVLAFGTLGIAGGGTGQITATAAFNALAPSQSGQSGKYLTTDGTNTSWGTNPLGTVTSVAATVPSFLSIAGSPITTSGTLAFTLSGTALPTTSGGTGLTSFTSGGVVYASSSSALATGSGLTFDGTSTLGMSGSAVSTSVKIDTTGRYKQFEAWASGNRRFYTGFDETSLVANITTDGNHPILFSTSGTEGMRLTSTGLGIGTSSPSYKLHAVKATAGNVITWSNAGSTPVAGTLYSDSSQVYVGDVSGNNGAYITPSTSIDWYVNGASKVAFLPSSTAIKNLLDISGASAGQIQFPATQNGSAGANVLDDYEEGTFTPTLTGSSVSGSQTYGTRHGSYTKIGRQVSLSFYLVLTAKGTISGNIYLSGYPFTSSNTANDVRYGRNIIGFENLATNWVWLSSINDANITYSYIAGLITAASTSATTNLTDADLTNTSQFSGSVIYNAS